MWRWWLRAGSEKVWVASPPKLAHPQPTPPPPPPSDAQLPAGSTALQMMLAAVDPTASAGGVRDQNRA
eukprot:gene8574-biopygen2705